MMRFHLFIVISCGLSALVGCRSLSQDAGSGSSSRSLADLQTAIDEYVQNLMSYKQIPGLSLAIVHGDTEQVAKGYGVRKLGTEEYVTNDTLFYIASTTKAITASVLLQTMLRNK
jgi:CubicO group peptidase (beta-lactamase class C family)